MIRIEEKHNLGVVLAKKKILDFGKKIKKEYADKISDYKEQWNGNNGIFSMKIMGYAITGEIFIDDSKVVVKGKVPLVLSFFTGQIENTIRKNLREILR